METEEPKERYFEKIVINSGDTQERLFEAIFVGIALALYPLGFLTIYLGDKPKEGIVLAIIGMFVLTLLFIRLVIKYKSSRKIAYKEIKT